MGERGGTAATSAFKWLAVALLGVALGLIVPIAAWGRIGAGWVWALVLAGLAFLLCAIVVNARETAADAAAVAVRSTAAADAGKIGLARVERVAEGGPYSNDMPTLRGELLIQPRDGAPFRTAFRLTPTVLEVPMWRAGTVRVVALPGYPESVAYHFVDRDPASVGMPALAASAADLPLLPAKPLRAPRPAVRPGVVAGRIGVLVVAAAAAIAVAHALARG